jgi:site-specific recombinase XerD
VITEAAGLGKTWVPRELRHTFVSLLSAHGVPVEAIALLAGHNQTATTELVYRHQNLSSCGAADIDQVTDDAAAAWLNTPERTGRGERRCRRDRTERGPAQPAE